MSSDPRQLIDFLGKSDYILTLLFLIAGGIAPGALYIIVFNYEWIQSFDVLKILFLSLILSSPFVFDGVVAARKKELEKKKGKKILILNALYFSFILAVASLLISFATQLIPNHQISQVTMFWVITFAITTIDLIFLEYESNKK